MRVLMAFALLGSVFGAIRYLDLPSLPISDTSAAALEPVSRSLPLPLGSLDAVRDQENGSPRAAAASATAVLSSTPPSENPPAHETADFIDDPADASLLSETDTDTEDVPATADSTVAMLEAPRSIDRTTSRRVEHEVKSGESLAKIFAQLNLDPTLLHRIVTSSKQAESLAQIRPGQTLRFVFEDDELTRLELQRSRTDSLRIAIADDDITTEEISKAVERRVASTAGVIESSLFVDGQKAGMSDGQIMELATIFGWDIDFALEIRAGDQFRVLYEEHYLDGEKLRDGPILAAEFTSRGTTFRAVRYEDKTGEVGYFDADGQSKRRAFIRTPIKFARVSSRFNPRRWHPVLKKWRSHKGVDYAAPTGTPVKATGDGRVVFRGTKGGYGKTVILEHAGRYQTLYAHLSKYSGRAAPGTRVKQGQVIGYVGKTGLASGPHLHYEFRVGGLHQDPLKVKLPKSLGLPKSEIVEFHEATDPLLAQLDAIAPETMVASAPADPRPTP